MKFGKLVRVMNVARSKLDAIRKGCEADGIHDMLMDSDPLLGFECMGDKLCVCRNWLRAVSESESHRRRFGA